MVQDALLDCFDPAVFERITPEWRWGLAFGVVADLCERWHPDGLPVAEWANDCIDRQPEDVPASMRFLLAELALLRGDSQRTVALIGTSHGGSAEALRAALLVQDGHWSEGQAAFENAFKLLKGETGSRKQLLPASLAWYYPLALLAQQTPKHVELARKFCLGEAGSKTPPIDQGWGLWCHVAAVRLGDAKLVPMALWPRPSLDYGLQGLWKHLLLAWLGRDTLHDNGSLDKFRSEARDHAKRLSAQFRQCKLQWLDQQLGCAEAVLGGQEPRHIFFAAGGEESWRTVLAALQALGDEATASGRPDSGSRILWSLKLGTGGLVEEVVPLEQRRGIRGWSKPKPASLAKLASNGALEPWDAKPARAIRQDRYNRRSYLLDRAVAITALIGHPAVVLAEAPEQTVDLVEGAPEMEVVRNGDQYSFRITPPVREAALTPHYRYDEDAENEAEALRLITVVQDSPQRLRVIRLTPAQRRAAQLLSTQLNVPAAEEAAIRQTVAALSSHFQIQSDHEPEARSVAADPLLRGELSPAGDDLVLRLVVAPLGERGPRLMPGRGRGRVFAAVGGESLSAQRDLSAEQAHLDAVLDALPFLDPPGRNDTACEWRITDPQRALEAVERLPDLSGVAAVDWPKGRSLRVVNIDAAQLGLQVSTGRDWFRLSGEAKLDQGMVLKLEEMLAWAGSGKGRFIPMGKGVYAALTERLREQLADLAAVAESGKDGVRVSHLAAVWLDDVLEGSGADVDSGFRQRIDRLAEAQRASFSVPHTLQTELRPYQEDGFVWASRLAAAGFGACLADDMGLGKTLQALALLLSRGAAGPALVVAPTSVCGNWLEEAARFAPTLRCIVYGDGDRANLVDQVGPMDVVIVSYTLLQQASERFAGRTWHTLVADEAQAVKNAAAKRSQALFEVPADFRLALSGTPVENRLAELWSIMRFCNPGLLGNLTRFNERFAAPIERDRSRDAQHLLRRLIAPFILRRTKAQVLQDLPPRTELILQVTAEPAEAAHYEALRREAVMAAEKAAASEQGGQARMNILAQLTRLRRAACDPRLVSPQLGIEGAKVQAFAQLASELAANGHKTLVFSQFVDFLSVLRAPLDAAGIAYQYLDGATPAAERTRRVAAFQAGEGDLFLISLKAGGFGLNLTAADYVVIADPWWNPAAEDQAMGRAHRIGQLRPVTVYRLVNKGTLEESIVALHHEKRALAEGILAEGEGAALPSTDDLIALIRGDA